TASRARFAASALASSSSGSSSAASSPSRARRNARSAARTGPALAATMSRLMRGSPLATRVRSRKPPAARSAFSARSSPSSIRLVSATAARYGRWLTAATSSSCFSGVVSMGRAPRPVTRPRAASSASGAVAATGVRTQTAFSRSPGSAFTTPARSLPAIGWPPTKRPGPPGHATPAIASTTGRLTLPTSVTTAVAGRWGRSAAARPGSSLVGAARTRRSTSASQSPCSSRASSMAPRPSAASRARGSWSKPTTRWARPRSRAPSATEPPIRPTPAMASVPRGRTSEGLPERPHDGLEARHQAGELGLVELLRGVGLRLLRPGVHLDDDPVGAGGGPGERQRRDQRAAARGVAGVDPHGQVRELLEHRYGADVEREARRGLERPDAALAEHHLRVALAEDVLRGLEELADRRGHAALEQHRLAG